MTSDGTKYGDKLPEDGAESLYEDDEEAKDEVDEDAVFVGTHYLEILDEREEIERYNGLAWRLHFDDETRLITGIGKAHYCPGPSHTDPMGYVAWNDVPEPVQERVLNELNVDEASEVVDVEATAEAAEVRRR